jgi:undecaprenyl-diphosphatase
VPGVAFEVALHGATLLSVAVVYRKRLAALATGALKGEGGSWRYLGLLILATLPAAAVGVGFGHRIEGMFEAPVVAGGALLVTGAFLWTTRAALHRSPDQEPALASALLMGLAQTLALVPGISRSGATVVTGLWKGVDPDEAAAFAFLMAIPAILGAMVLQIPELIQGGGGVGPGAYLAGGLSAALVGILAIHTFVAMLKKRAFHRFAPYCWAVGGAFLLYLGFTG